MTIKVRLNPAHEAAKQRQFVVAHRHVLCPRATDPIDCLDARILIEHHGFSYEEYPDISHAVPFDHALRRALHDTVGLLDRTAKTVAVLEGLPLGVKNFTRAHELGHLLLHEDMRIHRDRPSIPMDEKKPLKEREADIFAANFTMPGRWVITRFEETFLCKPPLRIDEGLAFLLAPQDPEAILQPHEQQKRSLVRELAVAAYSGFGGNRFPSMSEQFKVSNQAMAIRIKELHLIEDV